MKGFCYIALIIGFFIFYQQNPMYAIIIIVLFIGVYLFFKSRKAGGGVFAFLSGNQTQQNTKIDDLITLMMLQQLMNSNENRVLPRNEKEQERKSEIDKIKKEVLDLLDEE